MAAELQLFGSKLYSLGKNTVLCPWDKRYFFLEEIPFYGQTRHVGNLPDSMGLSQQLVSYVFGDKRPPASLLTSSLMVPSTSTRPSSSAGTRRPQLMHHDAAALQPRPNSAIGIRPSSLLLPDKSKPSVFRSKDVDMSEHERKKFEYLFDIACNGKDYVRGREAVEIFENSGLDSKQLHRIWDESDADGNGRLDKDEFIHAMWLIYQQLNTTSGPVEKKSDLDSRWCSRYVVCQTCLAKMPPERECYVCGDCKRDLCPSCYSHPSSRCPHRMLLRIIRTTHTVDTGHGNGRSLLETPALTTAICLTEADHRTTVMGPTPSLRPSQAGKRIKRKSTANRPGIRSSKSL